MKKIKRKFFTITLSKGELNELVCAMELDANYQDLGISELCKELKEVLDGEPAT